MRTNIDIDDELLTKAMEKFGTTTKKATIEEALQRALKSHDRRNAIANLRGVGWEGDLDDLRRMRQGRNFDHIK